MGVSSVGATLVVARLVVARRWQAFPILSHPSKILSILVQKLAGQPQGLPLRVLRCANLAKEYTWQPCYAATQR